MVRSDLQMASSTEKVPSGVTTTNLVVEVKSDDDSLSSWITLDPADTEQTKYYHLTFDGNLSDRISSVTLFQDGPTERLSLLGLTPQNTHRLTYGQSLQADANTSLTTEEWCISSLK